MAALGRSSRGPTPFALLADSVRSARATLDRDATLVALTAYLDGEASGGTGSQPVTAAAWHHDDGSLAVAGDEHVVVPGDEGRWVTFALAAPARLAAGEYQLGLHSGPAQGGTPPARAWGADPSRGGRRVSAAYVDGPPATLGAGTALTSDLALFGTLAGEWTPPEAPDLWIARLAFPEAQRLLSAGVSVAENRGQALLGLHGTTMDPERGSFCMVRAGGPLDDLVGDRLRITLGARSVVAYCHRSTDEYEEGEEDLTVTRRLYAALSLLSAETVRAHVEVLA